MVGGGSWGPEGGGRGSSSTPPPGQKHRVLHPQAGADLGVRPSGVERRGCEQGLGFRCGMDSGVPNLLSWGFSFDLSAQSGGRECRPLHGGCPPGVQSAFCIPPQGSPSSTPCLSPSPSCPSSVPSWHHAHPALGDTITETSPTIFPQETLSAGGEATGNVSVLVYGSEP